MDTTRRDVLALVLIGGLAGCGAPQPPRTASAPASAAAEASPAEPPQWSGDTRVGSIVAARPATARIFELVEIDYCCGGEQRLEDACREQGLDLQRVLGALHATAPHDDHRAPRSWNEAPLADLIAHIKDTHHARLRRDLPRLEAIVATVAEVHGRDHPELEEVNTRVHALAQAIPPHLTFEENELFPAILALPDGDKAASRELLVAMRTDHDEVGEALHRVRALTKGFAVPKGACALYKQMLGGLAELERDLHEHVHLENNVLLPRALAKLEDS